MLAFAEEAGEDTALAGKGDASIPQARMNAAAKTTWELDISCP